MPGMIEVAQATVTIIPNMQGAQQQITTELTGAGTNAGNAAGNAAGAAVQNTFGQRMGQAGAGMTKYVTAPLLAVGTAAFAAFSSVDEGMDTIVTKTGASGEALDAMEQNLRNIVSTIPTDFATAGAAIGEVNTRFGLTGSALESLSTQFIQFAAINGQDVSQSVDNASKVLAAFGLGAEDAGTMLDALNTVGQQTGVDVGTLSQQLYANAAQFQEMGLSATQAAAFLGQADMAGIDAATMLTGLKKAMQTATADGTTLDAVLAGFTASMSGNASEADKLAFAYEIFGTKAGAAIYNAVSQGTLSLTDFDGSLGDFAGSVASTFEGTLDPIDSVKMLLSTLAISGAELAESIMPLAQSFLEALIPAVQSLTAAWTSLSPETQKIIIYAGLGAAAAGPVLSGVSKVTTGVGGLITKLGGLGGGASGAAAKVTGLGTAAGGASGGLASAATSFANLAGKALMLVAVGEGINLAAQGIDTLADAAIKITSAGTEAEVALGLMVAGIGGLMAVAATLGPGLDAGALGMAAFGAAMLGAGEGINLATQGISGLVTAIGNASGGLSEITTAISDGFVGALTAAGTSISGVLDSAGGVITSFGTSVSGILDSVGGVFEKIGTAAKDSGEGFSTMVEAVKGLANDTKVTDLAATLGAVAGGIKDIKSAAKNLDTRTDSVNLFAESMTALGTAAELFSVDGVAAWNTSINGIADTTATAMAAAVENVKTGLADMQTALNSTELTLPQSYIPLPHFTIWGGESPYGVDGMGSLPSFSVSWYAAAAEQGAVFSQPTIIGVGDAREPEILIGRETLSREIRTAAAVGRDSDTVQLINAIAAFGNRIVKAIEEKDTNINMSGRKVNETQRRYTEQYERAVGA